MATCCRDQRMGMILFFGVLLCCFSFHVFVPSAATSSTNTSTPDLAASFLVNCGASGTSSDGDGRTWVGDVESNFTLSSLKSTSTDIAKNLDVVPSTPYSNARLNVDPGFNYLVRLHFCEIQYEITKPNQRVFDIFIHNPTAEEGFDVIASSDGIGNPYFKDYVLLLPQESGRQDLWVSLHPDVSQKPEYVDAILNGMEIFKLSHDGNLAGSNPIPAIKHSNPSNDIPLGEKTHVSTIVGVVVVVGFLVLVLLTYYLFRRRNRPTSINGNQTKQISIPSDISRHFTFAEMNDATLCFNENLILGVGGFGTVYRGKITIGSNGYCNVAIKRSNPKSVQGIVEFQTELDMLSKLSHHNLVSLIGYCHENGEMILVYDYMANGTFREHLYKTKNPPLPWKKRLEICIGAARGLKSAWPTGFLSVRKEEFLIRS